MPSSQRADAPAHHRERRCAARHASAPHRTSMDRVAARAGVLTVDAVPAFPRRGHPLRRVLRTLGQRPILCPISARASKIRDPDERLGVALDDLYAFYRRNDGMLENLFRDESTVPLVAERFVAFRGYLDQAAETLMAGRGPARRPPTPNGGRSRPRRRILHLEIARRRATARRRGRCPCALRSLVGKQREQAGLVEHRRRRGARPSRASSPASRRRRRSRSSSTPTAGDAAAGARGCARSPPRASGRAASRSARTSCPPAAPRPAAAPPPRIAGRARAGPRSARASARRRAARGSARPSIGPMPGVSAICSAVAASSASIVRKRWARLRPVTKPTLLDADREQHARRTARSLDASIAASSRLRADLAVALELHAAARRSAGRSRRRSRTRPFVHAASRPASRRARRCPSRPARRSASAAATGAPGQTRFGHLVKTAPSGLTVGVPQTGTSPAAAAAARGPCARRRAAPGETTCGITSPARRTMTSSPTRMSLRARSSSLCSVASLTVTPPTWTGSSTANGCRSPNLPTFHMMSLSVGDLRRRRELPGDRPARIAPDDAQAALQLELVDLDDDAVDLEVQRAAAVLPRAGTARRPPPRSSSRSTSPLTRKPCSRSHSRPRQCESNVMPSVAPMP